jgi:hypothetical protein
MEATINPCDHSGHRLGRLAKGCCEMVLPWRVPAGVQGWRVVEKKFVLIIVIHYLIEYID